MKESFFFLGRFLGREHVFFLFFLTVIVFFLDLFLGRERVFSLFFFFTWSLSWSYFLVFFYKFPPQNDGMLKCYDDRMVVCTNRVTWDHTPKKSPNLVLQTRGLGFDGSRNLSCLSFLLYNFCRIVFPFEIFMWLNFEWMKISFENKAIFSQHPVCKFFNYRYILTNW